MLCPKVDSSEAAAAKPGSVILLGPCCSPPPHPRFLPIFGAPGPRISPPDQYYSPGEERGRRGGVTDELSTVVPSPITRWGGQPPSPPLSIQASKLCINWSCSQPQLSRDPGFGCLYLESFKGLLFSRRLSALPHHPMIDIHKP